MSYWITTAGILSLAFTIVHIVGGGADVHSPLLASGLSVLLKGYVSVIWHGITATMALCSILLLIAAWRPSQRLTFTLLVSIHYLLFVVLFLFYGVERFHSVFVMPQWIGFLIIAVVALVGLWRDDGTAPKLVHS